MSDDSDKKIQTEDIDLSFGDDFDEDFDEVFSEEQLLVPADQDDSPTSSSVDEKTILVEGSDEFESPAAESEKTILVDEEGEDAVEPSFDAPQLPVQDEKTQLMEEDSEDLLEVDISGLQGEQTMAVESYQASVELDSDASTADTKKTEDLSDDAGELLDAMDSQEDSFENVQDSNVMFSDEGSGGQTEMLGQDFGAEDDQPLEIVETQDHDQDQDEAIDGLFANMNEDIELEDDSAEYDAHTADIRADTELAGASAEYAPDDASDDALDESSELQTVAPVIAASAAKKKPKSDKVSQPEASFIEAEKSTSRQNKKTTKRWVWIAPLGVLLLVAAYAGYAIFLTPQGFMGIGAKDDGAGIQAKQSGEKIQLTPDVLQSLDQKYDQAMQLAKVDRYPSYQKALSLIKEIQTMYSSHPKASSATVELMLMGNRGYMTVEQISKVMQEVRTAEKVSPNTTETLRAKIRLLVLQGKKDEALVRLTQLKNIAGEEIATDLLEAEVHLDFGELEQAKKALDTVFEKDADHIRAHYILAKYFFEKKQWNNVIKQTKPLLEAQHWASGILQGQALYAQKNYKESKDLFEELLATQEKQLSPVSYGQANKSLSDIYLQENNKPKAIELLEKAVSKVTLNDVYAKELGDLYFTDKNYTKAAQYYSLARNIKGDNIDYAINYGQVLRLLEKNKEAVEVLQPVITKAPNREDGVLEYAKSRIALNQNKDVQTYLSKVIEANPTFVKTLILTGDLHMQTNELDQAEAVYKKALSKAKTKDIKALSNFALGSMYVKMEKWTQAQKYLETSNQLNPNQTETLFMLGKVYYARAQFSKSQTYIQRSLNQDPDNLEAQGMLAGIYFKKGDQKESVALIQKVLEKAPNNIELRVMYGQILMGQGKYQDALDQMDEAYRMDAQRYDVHYYMGVSEREIGQTDLSIQSLNRALTILPESSNAYYQRGITYIRKNQIENAIKDMDKATELSKNWAEPYRTIAQYYFEVALYEKSLVYYEKANRIQKNDRQSDFQMAKAYFQQEQPQKALNLLTAMANQYPDYAPVYHEIGLILEESGDFESAFKYYQRATAKDPQFADSYQRMGFVYKNFDQNSNAVGMFKKYLNLRPEAIDRKDIEEEIIRMETQRP